jgi:hypothetical protein
MLVTLELLTDIGVMRVTGCPDRPVSPRVLPRSCWLPQASEERAIVALARRTAQLPALAPAILFSVLVPFLGPEAASAEMQRVREEK